MSLHTISNRVTYEGITQLPSREHTIATGSKIALAFFDGEPDLWLIDEGNTPILELKRYYADDWGDRKIPMFVGTVSEV